MEDGDWAISTCGEGIYTYDDSLLDELEDKCISKLSDNDYFGACKSFISISEDAFTFPLLSRIIISLIVGFFIAFSAVNIMKRKLITVQKQKCTFVIHKFSAFFQEFGRKFMKIKKFQDSQVL